MTATGQEQVIILGFGIISTIAAYYSFRFMESPELLTKTVGRLFFTTSLLFLLLIMNTVFLMSANDSTLSYLTDSVMTPALMVIYYSMVIGTCLYILFMIIGAFQYVSGAMKSWGTRQRSPRQKEDDS